MDRRYRDADFLRRRYVEAGQSASDIAEDCGVTRPDAVRPRNARAGVKRHASVTSSTVARWPARHGIEREPNDQDRAWLYEQYVDRGRRQQDIADDCGVSKSTISHWLSRHGITDGVAYERTHCDNCGESFRYAPSLRAGTYCSNACANDQRKRQVAVECVGCGETFERRASLDTEYCSIGCWGQDTRIEGDFYCGIWNEQRRKALERDGHQCVECGSSNSEHKARFGRELDVHHRVPVRQFAKWDCPIRDAHALRNLVTYCRTHHPDAPGSTTEPE